MKWYEFIAVTVVLIVGLYVVLAPWLSIIEIHKSIDRVTDEIRKWREERRMIDKVSSEDFIKAFGNGAKEDNKWIIIKSPLSEETVVKCPYCKEEFVGNDVEDYNFCPICGKQLKGGAE